MIDINKIISAVKKHHGGFENAEKESIITLWNSLDAETQKRYLAEEKTTDKQKG